MPSASTFRITGSPCLEPACLAVSSPEREMNLGALLRRQAGLRATRRGSGRRYGNYRSAHSAHPSEPQGRPVPDTTSRLIGGRYMTLKRLPPSATILPSARLWHRRADRFGPPAGARPPKNCTTLRDIISTGHAPFGATNRECLIWLNARAREKGSAGFTSARGGPVAARRRLDGQRQTRHGPAGNGAIPFLRDRIQSARAHRGTC